MVWLSMKSICFFNNKGGVGKTTLVANVAAFLATRRRKRVLVVDADPQCNATQLILGDRYVTKLYGQKSKVSDRRKPTAPLTLYDILRPIAIGDSSIVPPTELSPARENRFKVDLVPGDPRVALLEDKLSQAWLELSGGDIGGARQTNWNGQLLASVGSNYDYVFFDVGPSLGALNRSVLLGAQYFVTPMGCDVFSLFGVSNIAQWLNNWFSRYERSIDACRGAGFEAELSDFDVQLEISTVARFVGYTVQQYITKSRGGVRRATASYEKIRNKIPETVNAKLGAFMAPHVSPEDLQLPDVPHMYSLVPLAQSASCPIHELTPRDGLSGGQPQQKEAYIHFIEQLSDAIMANCDLGVAE